MFENATFKAYKKRIDPYLRPGEELLSATPVQAAGMMRGYLVGGEVGVLIRGAKRDRAVAGGGTREGGVEIPSQGILAITSDRLLIFKFGTGRSANPEFLWTNVPIGAVDSIDVGQARVALGPKPLTLTVHGESFALEVRSAIKTNSLISALEQAKGRVSGLRAS